MVECIYKQGMKAKVRFESTVGLLTTEQLWDLPLLHKTKANLNDVAIRVSADIKTTEDFVGTVVGIDAIAELKLEIVKDIIATKKLDMTSKINKAKSDAEVNKLEELIAAKKDETLQELSLEELEAKIEELKKA